MRYVRLVMAVISGCLLAAACSEAPTGPTRIAAEPAGPSSAYLLEPLIVKGKCDPIMSIDWCGGDPGDVDCMTSVASSDSDYTSGCYTGGGGGGPAGPSCTLPGDSDCDGDTWDEGPGVWILCVSTVLGTAAGGTGTYFAFQDYQHKLDHLNAAKRALDRYHAEGGAAAGHEYLVLSNAVWDAEEEARIAGGIAAASAGVTAAALVGAGIVCAPLIIAPTP
jgi:hypothetical protein